MNVRSIGLQNTASKINFAQNEESKTTQQDAPKYENPISRKKEKALLLVKYLRCLVIKTTFKVVFVIFLTHLYSKI